VGPGRHRGSCGHTVTNSEPESYTDSDSYAFAMRTDAIANSNGLTDAIDTGNADAYSVSHGDSNSFCDTNSNSHTFRHTYSYTYWKDKSDAEISPDASAKTIEIFATAKISNVPCLALHERGSLVIGKRYSFGRPSQPLASRSGQAVTRPICKR
jgi:hypothetical protein